MKKSYLVVYDYGTGGVWAVIIARSKVEITQKYPMLTVHDSRPSWMTEGAYQQILSVRTFDIDDPATGWLATALKGG